MRYCEMCHSIPIHLAERRAGLFGVEFSISGLPQDPAKRSMCSVRTVSGLAEPAMAEAPRTPKPLFKRLRKPGWYVLSCLIFLFYLWTATSSNRPFHLRDTSQEFYNQLTDSLMQGHTYLAAKPSPQLLALPNPYDPWLNERLRLHDASLYRGRYYLYFGVAPAVTLYLPWRMLTGKRLSDDIAVTLFSMGGYVFSCLLLFLLLEAAQMRVPWFLELAAVLALGLGQIAPVVLRRPRVYEVALSAAYCFLLGGLYFLALRVVRPNARRWLPALAAVFFGLAAASRPQCGIVAVLVAILYGAHLIRVRGLSGRPWLVEFARFALPLAIAGALIGWYNYSRFDNPLEFGIRYQVGVLNFATSGRPLATRLRYIFTSFYYLLVCPPNFMPRFPFFELSGAAQPFGDPNLFPKDYFQEPVAGAWLISPLCLAGFALPFLLWKRKRFHAEVRAILAGLVVCGFVMFAAVCSIPSASGRFGLDFVPVLLIAGLFLCLWLSTHLPSRWMRGAAVALTVAGCVWSSAVNMAVSANSYGYPLEQPYSPLFRSIATFFGAGPDALMDDVDILRLGATVIFPRAKPEVREPLLASGIYERSDLVFVQYMPKGKAMFSYVHSGMFDTWTPEIPISPGTPHRLTVDYSAAAKRVVVRLDDKAILDFPTTFFPSSRDRVTLGRMRVGRFGQRDFSGRMDVAPGGLVFVGRPVIAPRVYTSSPALDTVRPVAELLNYDLDGLLAHSARAVYGKQPARPPVLPQGVFKVTDAKDHFATQFQPVGSLGSPPVTAMEITVIDRAWDDRFGSVSMIFQDQGYHTLYSSGSLFTGEDHALVALPAGTRAVRIAFLANDWGYIKFPKLVRLRAFIDK